MTMFGSQWLANAGGSTYEIDQSIRFNRDDSAVLSRTPSSTSNRKTYTISLWYKIGEADNQSFFLAGDFPGGASPLFGGLQISGAGQLVFSEFPGGYYSIHVQTSAVLRDHSAWYHLVASVDTTQATASDRVKLYVNGELQTSLAVATYPSLNYDTYINSNSYVHRIGRYGVTSYYVDGYMAEYNFIDGTALDATSFGKTNAAGVWVPVEYTGAYGTNGFYITGATAADLGEDFSGNGNDYTSAGLATNDQVPDSPTNNYATLDQNFPLEGGGLLSNGNLTYRSNNTGNYPGRASTFWMTTGKWKFEATPNGGSFGQAYGIGLTKQGTYGVTAYNKAWLPNASYPWVSCIYYPYSQVVFVDGANQSAPASSPTTTSLYTVLFDADAKKCWFDIDGTLVNGDPEAGTGGFDVTGDTWSFSVGAGSSGYGWDCNFGQYAFTETGYPSFNACSTANIPEPTIKDGSAHFQTALHTGTGSSLAITQSGNSTFTPDLVWIKGRSAATYHAFYDVVRGVQKDQGIPTGAETTEATGLTAFNSNGAQVGALAKLNTNAATYADWMWKGGGASVSNAVGTLTSQVSANTTAGISVVTYTGTGAAATVGHGLGISPSFIILRRRDTSAVWYIWHTSVSGTNGNIALDGSGALSTNTALWNTGHTSTTFGVGNYAGLTANTGLFCAYVFASIAGFSAFGSYTGNGAADGPFISTGFKPAFVLVKRSSAAGNDWFIWDTARNTYNVATTVLSPNQAYAESGIGSQSIDLLSNGFKLRDSSANKNGSGSTYIYAAFAENPFGGENTSPATAR